jgi:hypothetical protein
MKNWLLHIPLLMLMPLVVQADSLRCGTKLVHEEDSKSVVQSKCGEASDISRSSLWRRPIVWIHGRPVHVGSDLLEVEVELWTYNFGPHRFMRRVRFENGLVVEIETLGYGYLK